jgi:beta-mannosidase
MWTGNNENLWGYEDWGWKERLGDLTWGAGFYFDLLPRIVSEVDPTRPYWPGSPYSGTRDLHPNDPAHGSMHIWDVWNTDDYTRYREYQPRFVAEFGFQAPPAYATLRRAISDEPLASDSPGMRVHQKADDGDRKLAAGLRAHLPEPRDFDDWHYLTQVNQARAIQLGIEHFRALRPVCMGTIVWQLNDCWPVTSWAAVDGDGRRKPLWYALRRAYADRLLTIQPRDGVPALVAVNETARGWTARVSARRLTTGGEQLADSRFEVEIPPFGAVTVPLPTAVAGGDDSDREVLVAEADGKRAWWFFAEDRAGRLPPARFEAIAKPTADGAEIVVTARSLLRDLTVFADRLDPAAEVDDALLTLLPGESATFTIRSAVALDPAALVTRPVLRCVNDIVPQSHERTAT